MGSLIDICGLLCCAGHARTGILAALSRRSAAVAASASSESPNGHSAELAPILIQVPIYRDHGMLSAVGEHIAQLKYPKALLEVQLLDDSPANEISPTECCAELLRRLEINVRIIRRDNRSGFKAGALNNGLKMSSAKYVVVLDSDFRLFPDFLDAVMLTLSYPTVIATQVRYSFSEPKTSAIGQLQNFVFNYLFDVEFPARRTLGASVFFVGTAGIWRREGILELGGWQETPFTAEDLDLSFRAIAYGYKIQYIDRELAVGQCALTYRDYRVQQRRWARGMLQAAWSSAGRPRKGKSSTIGVLLDYTTGLPHLAQMLPIPLICSSIMLDAFSPLVYVACVLGLLPLASLPIAYEEVRRSRLPLYRVLCQVGSSLLYLPALSSSYVAGCWDFLMNRKAEVIVTPKSTSSNPTPQLKVALHQSYQMAMIDGTALVLCVACALLALFRGNTVGFAVSISFALSMALSIVMTLRGEVEK